MNKKNRDLFPHLCDSGSAYNADVLPSASHLLALGAKNVPKESARLLRTASTLIFYRTIAASLCFT